MTKPDFEKELQFQTARSGGKGGQNVNKVETKVEASWYPENSSFLREDEKLLLLQKLSGKLHKDGALSVQCQTSRSQAENKAGAIDKLWAIVQKALTVPKKRKKSSIPKAAKEKRLQAKKIQSERKANRRGDF